MDSTNMFFSIVYLPVSVEQDAKENVLLHDMYLLFWISYSNSLRIIQFDMWWITCVLSWTFWMFIDTEFMIVFCKNVNIIKSLQQMHLNFLRCFCLQTAWCDLRKTCTRKHAKDFFFSLLTTLLIKWSITILFLNLGKYWLKVNLIINQK